MLGAAGIPLRGRLEVLVQLSSLRSRHVSGHLHRDRPWVRVGSTGRREQMRGLQQFQHSLGYMLMNTIMLTLALSTLEATAHRAVMRKELGGVERLK